MSEQAKKLEKPQETTPPQVPAPVEREKEIGGPKGLEPTRYGDWDVNGRCSDF